MSAARWFGIDLGLVRRRAGLGLGAGVVAGAAALLALGFAARAAEIALAHRFEPEIAALIVAASAAVVAIAAVVTIVLVARRTRREVSRAVAASTVVAVAPAAASLALRHVRLTAVVAAVGIGFWLTRRAR